MNKTYIANNLKKTSVRLKPDGKSVEIESRKAKNNKDARIKQLEAELEKLKKS